MNGGGGNAHTLGPTEVSRENPEGIISTSDDEGRPEMRRELSSTGKEWTISRYTMGSKQESLHIYVILSQVNLGPFNTIPIKAAFSSLKLSKFSLHMCHNHLQEIHSHSFWEFHIMYGNRSVSCT